MATESSPNGSPATTHKFRTALYAIALLVLSVLGAKIALSHISNPTASRPIDFLQVWSAGRLLVTGGNPYDGKAMYDLQVVNRMPTTRTPGFPQGHASMMWVPPWGLTIVAGLGVMSVDAAQFVWVYGQLGLIAVSSVWLWRSYGGNPSKWWVPVILAFACGPVYWQMIAGQYAGVLLLGLAAYVWAHRTNRPFLGGIALTLVALKPHLFLPIVVGMLIDAIRTPFGRRVVLGGMVGLAALGTIATLLNPNIWSWYLGAAGGNGPGAEWYPKLRDWFSPTVAGWIRHALPGEPFWVQLVPAIVTTVLFAGYWLRHGNPQHWHTTLLWVIPLGLITAPYGSWITDQTLFLVPAVWVLVRLEAAGWPIRAWPPLALYAAANIGVVLLLLNRVELQYYVWVTPVVSISLYLAWGATRAKVPQTETGRTRDDHGSFLRLAT